MPQSLPTGWKVAAPISIRAKVQICHTMAKLIGLFFLRCDKFFARQGRMHCHEIWQFNEQTGYQWLRGFQALCCDPFEN